MRYFSYIQDIKREIMKVIDHVNWTEEHWTEEQLNEKMSEYLSKADDTLNSPFDRDVYRQMYYYYKSLLMEKQDENN